MNQPTVSPGPQPIPVKGGGGGSVVIVLVAIVVLIGVIGILAAIAIPNFVKFQCRSKQSEARVNLKGIHNAMQRFRADNGRYPMTLSETGWEPRGVKVRYTYRIVESGPDFFSAEATGTGDMEGDRILIDEKSQLEHPENRCR